MKIDLRLDRKAPRRWHLTLASRLAARPEDAIAVTWSEGAAEPIPSCVSTLFALERVLGGLPEGGSAAATVSDFDAFARSDAQPDLVIDLAGGTAQTADRGWTLTFDGQHGDAALIGALLDRRMPVVALSDAATGEVVASGRPGSEAPGTVVAAFEDVTARTITMICAALDGARPRVEPGTERSRISCAEVRRRSAKTLARGAMHRIYRLLYRAPHWRVGWRLVDGPDLIDLGHHPEGGWRDLPDDGYRFYADPFPITIGAETHLFVEDFDHRIGRGVISAVAFDANGPVGVPRRVLETPTHLSYPFVFAHAGDVWMVPESCASLSVDLYRATRFPGGWVKEATLVSGVGASDATLLRHKGRWWMMATVRDGGGCFSDALHLWSSAALQGPWEPHPGNPVMIDVAAARPAGAVVERNGRLVRPVQDCREGYGVALGLAEIVRLDETGYEQRVFATLRSGDLWPGRRLHSLNRAGRLECIDGSAMASRFARGSRPG